MKRRHDDAQAGRQSLANYRPPGGSSCFFPSARSSSTSSGESKNSRSRRLPEGERLLIEDMNNLTLEERQKVYEEIHGVGSDHVVETEDMINQALAQIKEHLEKPNRRMGAYDRAAFLVPQRVQDRSFLLQFLRKEQFDAARGAYLVRKFMEFSLQFFGMNGLLRNPALEDINDDDLAALKTGMIYPLPGVSDRSGRPIVMYFSTLARFKHPENVIRSVFYVYTRILQDAAAQTKGVVIISWNYGDYVPVVPPNMFVLAASMWASMPVHISACHTCYDQISMVPLLELTRLAMGRSTRLRLRTHFGSRLESKYALLTYGIDASNFPLKNHDDTSIDVLVLHEWIEQQGHDESAQRVMEASSSVGIFPTTRDILLGRGQPFRVFPGNQELSRLVEANHASYVDSKQSRTILMNGIANQLFDQEGRRVLKRDSPTSPWVRASRQEAMKKIDSTFRNKKFVDQYHHEKDLKSFEW